MTIRLLTPEDEAIYRAALVAALDEEPREFFRIRPEDLEFPLLSEPRTDDFVLGAFSQSGELQGAVGLRREKVSLMRHKALLYRMFVTPHARGLGVGRALLMETLERARTVEGLEQVNLSVLAHNERAKGLYESFGFEAFSYEKRAAKTETRIFDEIGMVLFLHPKNTL